jgi:hypothetical protein
MDPTRWLRGSAALALVVSVPLLGSLDAPAAAADAPVVQGPWTVKVTYQSGDEDITFVSDEWRLSFGDGCTAGSACKVGGGTGLDKSKSTAMEPSANGFRITAHLDLDCHDTVTGALTTPHGADYDMTATLIASKVQDVGGTSYVTALTGTLVEDIVVNAAGRADNCTSPSGGFEEHKTSTLAGAADKMPAPPAAASTAPAGVGPGSEDTAAIGTGTIPGFTLPLGDEAARSIAAVDDGRRSSVPGALAVPSESVGTISDRLPEDLLLVAALGLLIVFPAQIFNSTYEENHERIEKAFGRLRRRRSSPASRPSR